MGGEGVIDLDELERLHEAATPGAAVAVADGPYYVAVCHDAPADPPGLVVGELRPADGALYVAARNALPELLRLARRARRLEDAMRAYETAAYKLLAADEAGDVDGLLLARNAIVAALRAALAEGEE